MDSQFGASLVGGAMAGLCVDLALFPLDTVKTRLQSSHGFWNSGGFRGIYSGLGSAAVGSMPGAALFFCTYEGVKAGMADRISPRYAFMSHMLAASFGEVTACIVRVPCEVVKQRAQALHKTSGKVLLTTINREGLKGLYRGYFSTVFREIPFSLIQFPLWEYFKEVWQRRQSHPLAAWQSSVCGAAAGALAAASTTPLDVAKTRIMLAEQSSHLSKGSIIVALTHVFSERGLSGCFAGMLPRVVWISVGGAIFLGIYDKTKSVCQKLFYKQQR